MSGIRVKAIVLGVLVDIGGSLISGVGLGIVLAILLLARGGPDLTRLEELESAWWMLATGYCLGIAFTLLGGFVAGRVAGEREVLHGALTGGVSALLGIPLSLTAPLWYGVLCFVSVPPAAMLGARLARRRVE